jgi:hypothetical protein
MSMASNVRNYLDRTGIHYSVDRHGSSVRASALTELLNEPRVVQ